MIDQEKLKAEIIQHKEIGLQMVSMLGETKELKVYITALDWVLDRIEELKNE